MASFDPFKVFYAVMGNLQNARRNNALSKWLRKSSRSRDGRRGGTNVSGVPAFFGNLKKTALIRGISRLILALAVLPRLLDYIVGRWTKKSGATKHFGKLADFMAKLSRTPFFRAVIEFAGAIFRWIRTRRWARIALFTVPTVAPIITAGLVLYSQQRSRDGLSRWYAEIAEEEYKRLERSVSQTRWAQQPSFEGSREIMADGPASGGLDDESDSYGEMLFRKVYSLRNNSRTKIAIGRVMMARGATEKARRMLRKFAPDDGKGKPEAHGIMAAGYLMEYYKTMDVSLLPLFQHHLEAAAPWRTVHPIVLRNAGDLYWRSGNKTKAVQCLGVAAQMQPEFSGLLVKYANEAGQTRVANMARTKGIEYFQRMLEHSPGDYMATIHLAYLLSSNKDGMVQAEQLLLSALSRNPHPNFAGALSEVYRQQFLEYMKTDPKKAASALHKAIVYYPTNPQVVDEIVDIMSEEAEDRDELVSELNTMLVSANETTGVHAMLSEYHLGKANLAETKVDRDKHAVQAILHLEQVYKIAPLAIYYVNQLAHSYAVFEGNLEKAMEVITKTKATLEQHHRMNEPHADALMETLGKIHQKQGRIAEAIAAYEKSVEINPGSADVRRRLAKAYRLRNDSNNEDESKAQLQENLAERIEKTNRELTAFEQSVSRKQKNDADGTKSRPE